MLGTIKPKPDPVMEKPDEGNATLAQNEMFISRFDASRGNNQDRLTRHVQAGYTMNLDIKKKEKEKKRS